MRLVKINDNAYVNPVLVSSVTREMLNGKEEVFVYLAEIDRNSTRIKSIYSLGETIQKVCEDTMADLEKSRIKCHIIKRKRKENDS